MATLEFPVPLDYASAGFNAEQLAFNIDSILEWTGTVCGSLVLDDVRTIRVTNDVLEETDILRSEVQQVIDSYVFDETFAIVDGQPVNLRPLADVQADVAALPPDQRDTLLSALIADYLFGRPQVATAAGVPIQTSHAAVVRVIEPPP
jgi:hypothetical protein